MRVEGEIKNVIRAKNFGFILHKGNEFFFHRDDFVGHWDDLLKDFEIGSEIRVEFSPQHTYKGPRANMVSRLDWPNQAV
jgi:cold shock CspA family protein